MLDERNEVAMEGATLSQTKEQQVAAGRKRESQGRALSGRQHRRRQGQANMSGRRVRDGASICTWCEALKKYVTEWGVDGFSLEAEKKE